MIVARQWLDRHLRGYPEPSEGLAVCRSKGVPSFLSFLRSRVLFRSRESDPGPHALQSSALLTEPILLRWIITFSMAEVLVLNWTELGPWLLILNPCVHLGNYCVIPLILIIFQLNAIDKGKSKGTLNLIALELLKILRILKRKKLKIIFDNF